MYDPAYGPACGACLTAGASPGYGRLRGLGTWGGGCTEGSSRMRRRAAGRSRRRQSPPTGAEGSSPESLRRARTQARGQIANEKWLTAGSSAPRRGRQLLYFQYMSHCSRRRKTTVCRNFLRHFVTRQLHKSLYTTYQTCLPTPVLPSAPSLLYGATPLWSTPQQSFGSACLAWSRCKPRLAGVDATHDSGRGSTPPMHGCKTTVTVDHSSNCRPLEVWTQPCGFLLLMDCARRDGCVSSARSGHP